MIDDIATTRRSDRLAASARAPRTDIQALRAIAVGLVVLNHLWPLSVPGGYVGVDVFFVISGFLISKHLLGELELTGRIKLAKFYARRVKRLLPAALLVSVVSLITVWVCLPFSRWAVSAQETIAATLYLENWALAAKSVDYSAHNQAASTVQHYWSLSVEEQFYLVWPVLLLGIFVLAGRVELRVRRAFFLSLSVLGVISFLFSDYLTSTGRSEAYFVTPGRVWEFVAGALVALAASNWFLKPSRPGRLRLAGAAQALGYGMIGFAALTYGVETDFPGAAALVPVAGTLLVIASGPRSPLWSPNTVLSARPVQFLGDVSYSIYLWHWPLIIVAPDILNRNLTDVDKVGLLATSILLAAMTKRWVEDPGRTKLLAGSSSRKVLGFTAAAMVAVCVLSGTVIASSAIAQKSELAKLDSISGGPCYGAKSLDPTHSCELPFGPPEVENVGEDEAPWFDAPECRVHEDPIVVQDRTILNDCDFTGGGTASASVWLIGDSHAEQWKTGIFELARQNHWQLNESLVGGCPIVDAKRVAFMGTPTKDAESQERCLDWSAEVSDRILEEKPHMVFLSNFASQEKIDDGTGRNQLSQYDDAFRKRVGKWAENGTQVYVIRDTPLTLGRSTPECLSLNSNPLNCSNDKDRALPADPLVEAAQGMEDVSVKVIDLSDQFCPDDRCYAAIGGLHVYYDNDHASGSYIRSLVPVLAARFQEVRSS